MRAEDDTLYETMLKVENKDIFIDLKRNKSGVYLKISERSGSSRNTVLIPISGITRLKKVLDDVSAASETIKVVRRDRKQRAAGDPEVVARSVYVTGLTWDTEEDELINHFSQVGPVVTAVVLRQRRNGNLKASMGCGVVEYETREAAVEAISVLNETELKGRAIRVREDRAPEDEIAEETSPAGQSRAVTLAPPSKSVKKVPRKSPEDRSNVPEPNKVFVTSLTSDVTDEILAEYFSTIGTVVSAEILSTRKGRSICSGIVCFEDNASVTESINKLSNVDFRGRSIVESRSIASNSPSDRRNKPPALRRISALKIMEDTAIVDTEGPAVELEEKKDLDYDVWDGVDEIVSLCMSCGANGMTRLMLHKIPYFRELIIASFCCDECGERNNEVSFGGEIQPQGCVYDLVVTNQKDLDRQMIKSDSASVRIPELDFEIPSSTQKGEINTIEGFLRNAAKNLSMYQDERMAQMPETGIVVALVILGLNQMADGHKSRLPFHLILDDPAGNSYVQNPLAPMKDAAVQELHYSRSAAQDISLGLQPEKETGVFKSDADSNYKALMGGEGSRGFGEVAAPAVEKPVNNDYNSAANVGGGFLSTVISDEAVRLGRSEVVSIPSPCPHCGVEGESLTALTDIPHFKEVIIMAFNCSACGFRNNEVKAGGAVPDMGTEVTLVVTCADDLRRDVLKSDSCMVLIPELELELGCGTLGGVYTTVEGLVKKIHTSLGNSNPFAIGDSTTLNHSEDVEVTTSKSRFKTFLNRLEEFGAGTVLPFTLILRDPLGNSFVSAPLGSFLPPESDFSITMVDFERSYEENEDFGLNDINTKDFETGFEGEKLAILSDRLTHVVTAGPDHPSFFAKGMDDATPGGAYVAGSVPPPTVEYTETDPSYIVVPPPGWTAAKSSSAAVEDHSAELGRGVHETQESPVEEALPYVGYGKRVFDEADFTLEYAPREEFAGARKGFAFRMGGQGIGYYKDVPEPAEIDA